MKPLINLDVSPQGEELEFLINTGADGSSINKLPKGCELSKQTRNVRGAKGETFEVSVFKEVIIRGNSKEEDCDLLYMLSWSAVC